MDRRVLVEWSDRKMIIGTFSDRELFLKVIKGKEPVRSIEFFIVFPVAAFDFPIVPRSVWFDQLVSNISKICQIATR